MSELIELDLAQAEDLVCRPTASIREAMERLNAARFPFQLVIDEQGKLVGTVTDGDLRRALLKPVVALDSSVAAAANRQPLTGLYGGGAHNAVKLRSTRGVVQFLPLLDAENRCRGVIVGMGARSAVTAALIMAGGFGKRLGDLTLSTPKPLLHVGGRPILSHILSRLDRSGIKRAFIAVHHLATQFEQFAQDHQGAIALSLLHENEPLGTAGAIGLLPEFSEPFLVVNGDVLTNVDYALLSEGHQSHGNDATIAVAQYEHELPYGVVKHSATGAFLGVEEKPTVRQFVAAGIYVVSPVFRALVKQGERLDMPELLNLGLSAGLKIGLLPIHEYWKDIGRPGDLQSADREHASVDKAF